MQRNNKIRLLLRILLPIACILWLAFIISNSLQTGEQSIEQSTAVVDKVQDMAQVIAPQSPIANATGEAYDRLHIQIRDLAHFIQFMVLGILVGWCYLAYSLKLRYFFVPVILMLLIPIFDEWIQGCFSEGRGAELADVLNDTLGALIGLIVALISGFIAVWMYRRKTRKVA